MDLTDVKIFFCSSDKVLAFASVTFDGVFVVKGFRVMPGQDGPWVAFPSEKGKDGKYRDNVFFTAKNLNDNLKAKILEYYNLQSQPENTRPQYPQAQMPEQADLLF